MAEPTLSLSIILEVISATTTAWLPLPTVLLPSNPACARQIYAPDPNGLVAFDVIYPDDINTAATRCLPPQATLWWLQDRIASPTVTKLGPNFACPAMYSEVRNFIESRSTAYIMCCPTGYNLGVAASPKGFAPTQCVSAVSRGQTVTFATQVTAGSWKTTSTVNSAATKFVLAQHVNGYFVSSTSSSSSLLTSSTAPPTTSSQISQNTTLPANTDVPEEGLATPAKIGIGVGAGALGLAMLLGLVWFLMRRRRAKGTEAGQNVVFEKGEDPTRVEMGTHGDANGNGAAGAFGQSHYEPAKVVQPQNNRPYELQ